METVENKTKVRESDVSVGDVQIIKTKPAVIIRSIPSDSIANDLASRITAKLIGFDDLYDPKTRKFLTENELRAKGAVFVTIRFDKVLVTGSDTVKKGRTSKTPTPFIRKTSAYQVIVNINWASYINKRGSGDFIPEKHRANGVKNYENCKGIGKTRAGNSTINGVAFRVIDKTRYFDENDNEYEKSFITKEYLNSPSKASKEKQARKHGIDVRFDPSYRTTRIDSCESIRCFGFDYRPSDRVTG